MIDPPAKPPTKESLLEVFRTTTPREYHDPIASHESYALFRALAQQLAAVAQKGARSIQGRYYLPHSLQADVPASGPVRARGVVTLERRSALDVALHFTSGSLRFEAVGRTFVNEHDVRWLPGDALPREVSIVADTPGFFANLDHVSDSDGMLPLEHISLAVQSRGRAGVAATITAGLGSVVQDRGVPDVFAPEDVGLYLRITSSSSLANIGVVRRITGFVWPEVEIPVTSGRYPRRVFLDDVVLRNAGEVLVDNGGVITDQTSAASLEVGGSVVLLPAPLTVGDAFYVGYPQRFSGIDVTIATPGEYTGEVVWEYWTGAAWAEIPGVQDPASGWRHATPGVADLRWLPPADWATRLSPGGSGLSQFYVRGRLDSVSSSTTVPVGARVVVHVPEPLAADAGTAQWQLLDARDLDIVITDCEAPRGGRDDDLWLLGDERGVYRQPGEPDDEFRERAARVADVVSPNAIVRAVNRALAPFNFRGAAIDVGSGLTGLFLDLPADQVDVHSAVDLYGPGDVYPTDPWQLPLDYGEAHGWGLVLVPPLSAGEFGTSLDEAAVLPEGQGWTSGAADVACCDGYPITAYGAYGALHNQISRIKLDGVRFEIQRDSTLEPDTC
jgi:hypothetical protein